MTLAIPANETGMIRVFAVNRPAPDMTSALQKRPGADLARDLLSAPHLNTSSTEVFAMSDLAGIGLAAYLADGYAVKDEALAPDRPKLDALDGYVLLLFSDSFGGKAATLDPGPDVTLIGTYREARANMAAQPIKSAAAQPYSGAKPPPNAQVRTRSGSLFVAVIAVLVLLLFWWMLA